jgi:hypothetical protein
VTIHLGNGRVLTLYADGARGYPARPASESELGEKFLSCAGAVLSREASALALGILRQFEALPDVRILTGALVP